MRIKTFYAKSMGEAMREIKAALGPDALLLSTREIANRSGVGGPASGFEVVAACDSPIPADSDCDCPAPPGLTVDVSEHFGSQALTDDNKKVDDAARMYVPVFLRGPETTASRALMSRHRPCARLAKVVTGGRPDSPFRDEHFSDLFQDLTARGVEEWLAHKLLMDAGELV